MQNFKLVEVLETLNKKRTVYLSLIQKVFNVDESMASNVFDSEIENFKERLKTYYDNEKNKPTLTVLQGTNIFLEVIHLGLSFSKSADLVYLSRLKGTGTAIGYQPTVRGEIFMATNSGSISHISEPVIVKNSEDFRLRTNEQGKLIAHHEIDFSNQSFDYSKDFKIGYCYITYPSGDREISFTDKVKMDKSYSLSPSKAMYNDITFLQSKVIRRALHQTRKATLHNQMEVVESIFEETDMVSLPKQSTTTVTPTKPTSKPTSKPDQQLKPTSNKIEPNFDFEDVKEVEMAEEVEMVQEQKPSIEEGLFDF